MDCFSLLACLPSLRPIATHISNKSKHLRERKNMHTNDSGLLTNKSPPGNAAFDMPSSTEISSDDRQSQILDSSFDLEKGAEALRSETDVATRCVSELE